MRELVCAARQTAVVRHGYYQKRGIPYIVVSPAGVDRLLTNKEVYRACTVFKGYHLKEEHARHVR